MKIIGGISFFATVRGAKNAATRMEYKNSRIIATLVGYALIAQCEGASEESYAILSNGREVAFQTGTGWVENKSKIKAELDALYELYDLDEH